MISLPALLSLGILNINGFCWFRYHQQENNYLYHQILRIDLFYLNLHKPCVKNVSTQEVVLWGNFGILKLPNNLLKLKKLPPENN